MRGQQADIHPYRDVWVRIRVYGFLLSVLLVRMTGGWLLGVITVDTKLFKHIYSNISLVGNNLLGQGR